MTKIPTLKMGKAIVFQLMLKATMKLFKRNPYPLSLTYCSSQPVELSPGYPMSAIDIGHIMLAAMKGDHIFCVEFANLGILEFHQVVFLICFIFKLMLFSLISFVLFIQDPDPKYFNIEGKNGFFKARKRPYKPLELYGYDLYDAFQWSKKGIFCIQCDNGQR